MFFEFIRLVFVALAVVLAIVLVLCASYLLLGWWWLSRLGGGPYGPLDWGGDEGLAGDLNELPSSGYATDPSWTETSSGVAEDARILFAGVSGGARRCTPCGLELDETGRCPIHG